MFEILESRRMLSAAPLTITGTNGPDTLVVQQTVNHGDGSVDLTVNATTYTNVTSLTIKALAGNDYVGVNDITIPTTVLGGAGDDILNVFNSAAGPAKTLSGDEGQDLIVSIGNGDVLLGGEGKDALIATNTTGAHLDGGNGNDELFVFSSTGTIVDGGNGKDTMTTDSDSLASILTSSNVETTNVI
jgi:hypothetical protein